VYLAGEKIRVVLEKNAAEHFARQNVPIFV
jgi:hypothetical protein